ncbi:MAG: hypothetical protein KZQ78_13480 [Candidatus Thiodiazotropha sp. (ex Ustalcina ferruginea)]|nr:hypothetical protein [Candidatus Thiodiazotropha sp. (ex Ustalcina ferruginea)]
MCQRRSILAKKRVALTPSVTQKLQQPGFTISMESGARQGAKFSDGEYREAGEEMLSVPYSLPGCR